MVEGIPSKIHEIGAALLGSFEGCWGRQDRQAQLLQVRLGKKIDPASASPGEGMEGAHSIGTAVADHNPSRKLWPVLAVQVEAD